MIKNELKLDSYLNYFAGREDYLGVQKPSGKGYYPIKSKLNESIIKKHIAGIETFGVYVLNSKSQCNFICIDIDIAKNELSKIDFNDANNKFEYLRKELLPLKDLLENELFCADNILYEETGGRGYHVWIFFDKPIDAIKVRWLNEILIKRLTFSFEFFPKQTTLNEKREYGNLIKLPLGEHQNYNRRSFFFTFNENRIDLINSIEDNITKLENIVKVSHEYFNTVIEKFKEDISINSEPFILEQYKSYDRKIFKKDFHKLYAQCNAIGNLKVKAEKGEALNHSELFHFTNTLLSIENSKDEIHSIIKSSLGEKYSFHVTEKEMQSIIPLKPANCKKLIKNGICQGYCKEEFKIKNEETSFKNTSPLYSLIPIKLIKKKKPSTNLLEDIANPENIRLAFYKLRDYHKYEDVLFFDEFDFEFFEEDFDNNILQISIVLKNKIIIPQVNYEKVKIPKKIDDNGKKVYRQLTYSSVFDQIIIQAIFNVVGEILEYHFEDNSYGYRLNVNNILSNNIFEDWREKYPDFRNTILNKLREPEIKYYICCDIKGYYDNIKKDLLKTQLRSIIDDDYVFGLLKQIIDVYSYDDEGDLNLGIPQGPAYARVLANLYLNKFDKEILKKANYYYRYVDDFYILIDDLEKAKEILEWVVLRLGHLGLRLSDSIDKEAAIIDANDERILQDKIDSVRYGLFEDFKFLPNLSKQQIKSFYDTILQKTYNANDKNKEIPTLIYFGNGAHIDDQRKQLIIEIVEELARENSFFPKKVKKLFPPLLDLYRSLNQNFIPFFNLIEETDKAFFLLALYEKFKEKQDDYNDKLKQVLLASFVSEDIFFKGFGLMIHFRNPQIIDSPVTQEFVAKIVSYNSVFLESKLYRTINYFEKSRDIQTEIDNHLKTSTNYLTKKGFLSGIRDTNNITELDNEIIKRILSSNCHLLHSEACRIISLIKTKQPFFTSLINFIETEKPKFNTFISDLLGKRIYEEYKVADDRKLENLILLFKDQCVEIQNIVNQVVNNIKKKFTSSTISYWENHNLLDSYNDCSYYVSNSNKNKYLEIIPFKDNNWYESLKLHVERLGESDIIPKTDILYDSFGAIVVLNTLMNEEYKKVEDFSFSINNHQECLNLFCLINNIYMKANRYFTISGKIPLIESENIKVIDEHFDIFFLKRGKDNSSQYFCGNEFIDSSKRENIAKLLYNFTFNLLFKNSKTDLDHFLSNSKSKVGISLFVDYFLKRLKSGEISVERLAYLYNNIEKINVEDKTSLSFVFYSEKLKSNLFKNCELSINWHGITNGVVELYQDFAVTYQEINFQKIKYENMLFLNFGIPNNLNSLSKIVFNINLNLPRILSDYKNEFYLYYFRLLNYFGIYCLEIHSLYKFLLKDRKKIKLLSFQISRIEYEGISQPIFKDEIQSINRLIKVYKSSENYVFKNSSLYSLKEMGILCLLIYCEHKIENNRILLIKKKQQEGLINLLLALNPIVEKDIYNLVSLVNNSLVNNYKQPNFSNEKVEQIEKTIIELLFLIKKIMKRWGIKRGSSKYHLTLGNKNFVFIGLLHRNKKEIPVLKTSNNPFTDTSFYYEKNGKLYYERKKREIFNIIVPNQRIITLHNYLKKRNIYYNKGMLIPDVAISVALSIIYSFLFTLKPVDFTYLKGNLEILKLIGGAILSFFYLKIFYDLRYWIDGFDSFLKKIKTSN